MTPTSQFKQIAALLDAPTTDGSISTYVKKSISELTPMELENQTDMILSETLSTLKDLLQEATEVAMSNGNPESFSAASVVAKTILEAIKTAKGKKPSKVVNNNLSVGSTDDAIKLIKQARGNQI